MSSFSMHREFTHTRWAIFSISLLVVAYMAYTSVQQESAPILHTSPELLLRDHSSRNYPARQNHNYAHKNSLVADLASLKSISSSDGRKKWMKENWKYVDILQEDGKASEFERRINNFLAKDKPKCSQIFFTVWLSSLSSFGPREKICIESIFKHHPYACVVIVSNSLDSPQGDELLAPFLERGFSIIALAPHLTSILNSTPTLDWLHNLTLGTIDPGEKFFLQNLSDLLRLALLYKYGGVYLDMDVIVLRSFAHLHNVIGAQGVHAKSNQWFRLNGAVLVFDKGHPLLHLFMEEFASTFDGTIWAYNGPYLLTRVVTRLEHPNCTVLPPLAFYPVLWKEIGRLFQYKPHNSTELEGSYALHLWNSNSRKIKIEKGSVIHHTFLNNCIFCDVETF